MPESKTGVGLECAFAGLVQGIENYISCACVADALH
jgi:hypothetical protein